MRREGGTTLTSPARAWAMAARRFSLLLPSGYAWMMRKTNVSNGAQTAVVLFYLTNTCKWNVCQRETGFVNRLTSLNTGGQSPHWTYLSGIEVGAGQQVLQVDVSLWLCLFQHNHGVSLPEEWTSSTQLSQLNQLQHHLGGTKQQRRSQSDRDRKCNLLLALNTKKLNWGNFSVRHWGNISWEVEAAAPSVRVPSISCLLVRVRWKEKWTGCLVILCTVNPEAKLQIYQPTYVPTLTCHKQTAKIRAPSFSSHSLCFSDRHTRHTSSYILSLD